MVKIHFETLRGDRFPEPMGWVREWPTVPRMEEWVEMLVPLGDEMEPTMFQVHSVTHCPDKTLSDADVLVRLM